MTATARTRWERKLARLGQLSFQGRLEAVLDPGSIALLSAPDWETAWGEAVTTVRGAIGGRPVYAYATHFLIQEGTIGEAEALAIAAVYDRAAAEGAPLLALLHSNGARVADHYQTLAANATMFKAITRASGRMPIVAVCTGLALGVAAYMAALADFCWMVEGQSYAATTSPAVVKVATGQSPSLEELGGGAMHAEHSGVAHFLVSSEAEALAGVRQQIALFAWERRGMGAAQHGAHDGAKTGPGHVFARDGLKAGQGQSLVDEAAAAKQTFAGANPPDSDRSRGGGFSARVPAPNPSHLVPADPRLTYDVHKLITALIDPGSFLESHTRWAKNLVTGFATLDGLPLALIANQPRVKSGVLDTNAFRKGARFAQIADGWGLSLLYLVDVPGIMVSAHEERRGVLSAGALFFHAVDTDVPRVALVVRKCYGGAFVMLQARQAGGDRVLAWPDAHVGISGPEVAFTIQHGKESKTQVDGDAFREARLADLAQVRTGVQAAVAAGIVDAIVEPANTRDTLIATFAALRAETPRALSPCHKAVWPV